MRSYRAPHQDLYRATNLWHVACDHIWTTWCSDCLDSLLYGTRTSYVYMYFSVQYSHWRSMHIHLHECILCINKCKFIFHRAICWYVRLAYQRTKHQASLFGCIAQGRHVSHRLQLEWFGCLDVRPSAYLAALYSRAAQAIGEIEKLCKNASRIECLIYFSRCDDRRRLIFSFDFYFFCSMCFTKP